MSKEPSLGFLLMKTSRVVSYLYRKELMSINIGAPQSSIILVLNEAGELCQTQISSALNLDKANASILLKHMAEDGLVKSRQDGRDHRKSIFSLTPEGKKYVPKICEVDKRVSKDVEQILGPQLAKQAQKILQKFHEDQRRL